MQFTRKFLNYLKNLTDSGILFRIRAYILYILLYICNINLVLRLGMKRLRLKKSGKDKNIAMLSMYRPLFWHGSILESQFYQSLEQRGLKPLRITCRGFLDVCDVHYFQSNKQNNPTVCHDCRLRNDLFNEKNTLDTLVLDDYLHHSEIATELEKVERIKSINEAKAYRYDDLPLGKLVHLSTCRYWLRLTLDARHLEVYKKFLRSALKLHNAFYHLLEEYDFKNFLIFNGQYAVNNIPLQLIKRKHLNYSTYEFSEQERLLFSKNEIAVLWADVKTKFDHWRSVNKSSAQLMAEVNQFIDQRRQKFVSSFVDMSSSLVVADADVAAFTNVVWDSSAFDRETLFKNQFDWISQLIHWAECHPDKRMVIRIHPAEINVTYNKTVEQMLPYIKEAHPVLPSNVRIIPPDMRQNSYALIEKAKVVCVYTSTVGLEGALMGKCVLTAASSHYMHEGVTLNPTTLEDYFAILAEQTSAAVPYTPNRELVYLYAYWFYKVHHRLYQTHLYKKPFSLIEDSRFLRVPLVDPKLVTPEFNQLVDEFLERTDG